MIKSSKSISQVKEFILALREKPIEVEVSLGRNKTVKFCGKLSGVYPALFTVAPEVKDYRIKTAYSYSEYMCGKIKLKEIKQ